MAGSYTRPTSPCVCPGLTLLLYDATLAGTCTIVTGLCLILGANATYKTCADASVHLEVGWTDDVVTVTGKALATDTVSVVVHGLS